MHLLEIDRAGEALVQGFVRAEWPSSADLRGGLAAAWVRMYLRSAALWSQIRLRSAGLRIALEPGRPVTTVHSFVVDKAEEPRLRLLLAAFLRTEGIGTGKAEALQLGMELAGSFVHSGETRIGLKRETLTTSDGLMILHNVQLWDLLPRLLPALADFGIPFAYEFQTAPWMMPREALKPVLYNAARLVDTPGIPKEIAEDQVRLGERGKRAGFHVEECFAAVRPEVAAAISDSLAHQMAEGIYARFGAAPRIAAIERPLADAFAHHVHSHLMLGPPGTEVADSVTAAATHEEVHRTLSCIALGLGAVPAAESAEPLALRLGTFDLVGAGAAHSLSTVQPPSSGGSAIGASAAPSLFVSYARNDKDLVYPLVARLQQKGTGLWIDRRLIGGDDWLAELEEQLTLCRGVLAFVSPSFVASRYCCREVRFADALGKIIIPVQLAPASLSGGLNFILHAIQQISASLSDADAAIIDAIRTHARDVLQHP